MPWEKGPFKHIFKKPGVVEQPVVQQPRAWVGIDAEPEAVGPELVAELSDIPGNLSGAVFEQAISGVSGKTFIQQKQDLLEMAVQKWHCIIRVNMLASAVGRDIIGLGSIQNHLCKQAPERDP